MSKRIVSLCLAVLMLTGLFAGTASAAPTLDDAMAEVNIYAKDKELVWLTMNGTVEGQHYTYYLYRSEQSGEVKEIPAYCVDPRLKGVPVLVPEGESIKYSAESTVNDPKVCGIIANGYPHIDMGTLGVANIEEAYYATKTALWIYLLSSWSLDGLGINPSLSGENRAAAERVLQAVRNIYNRGMRWNGLETPKITVTADRDVAYPVTVNGQQYYQQVLTVASETWAIGESLQFSLPAGVPEGTKVVGMNNEDIVSIKLTTSGNVYEGQCKILYPAASVEGQTGMVQLNISGTVVQYAIYYARSLETDKYGNIQDYMLDTDPHIPMQASFVSAYSHTPEPEGTNLRIVKREKGTETPLEGAVFVVTGPDGVPVGRFTSGMDGTVTIPLDVTGHYTVEEIEPPAWHLPSENPVQHVEVRHNETAIVSYYNGSYGNLSVKKVSGTGDALNGVLVQIKHIESGLTLSQKTSGAGVACFEKLEPGTWEVTELAGITGWEAETGTPQNITVVAGETSEATIINEELPGLRVVKYDRTSHRLMPGVTFEIFRGNVSLGTFQTDERGEILLLNQPAGSYRIEERDTGNDTHIVDPTPQYVELTTGMGIVERAFFNDLLPGMHLIKVDSSDLSKPIPNVKFRFEAVDGSYGPVELTTGADGTIDLSSLPATAFVVTELECPGYVIDEPQRIIELRPNATAQFVFTNSELPKLKLTKTSSDGAPLGGVSFRLAKIEDGGRYLDRTTSADGTILWEGLDPGIYSLLETATVDDHIIDLREYHVQLFPGKKSEVVLENQKRPNLTVWKYDADDGVTPVPDTTFLVEYADGHSVGEIKTGPDGSATLENLLPGVYKTSEKSVRSPYLMDAEPQLVTLFPNRDREVFFYNHKAPSIVIEKVDSITKAPLPNVRFRVWYGSNSTETGELNDLGVFTTDESGRIDLTGPEHGLRDGWFRVRELLPPTGYAIKDSDTQEAFVPAGKSKTFHFENTPLSALVVYKYDEKTSAAIEGAIFQLRYLGGTSGTGGTVVGTYKTSANGSFTVTGLKEGTYICEEVRSSPFYTIDTAPQTVYISGEEQDVVHLYFGNQPYGTVILKKLSGDTGHAPLAGAVFMVTDDAGAVVGTANGEFTSDQSGMVQLPKVPAGTTIVAREIRAPEGHALDGTPQTVYVQAGEVHTLSFYNAPLCNLSILKRDSVTKLPLAGAEFLVTDGEGKPIGGSNGRYTSGSDGLVTITGLTPDQTVVVREEKAPAGYVKDPEVKTITVKSGVPNSLVFENTPMTTLVLQKYIEGTDNEPLAGVEFLVTDSSGAVVGPNNGRYVTGSDGRVVISGLPAGTTVTAREVKTVSGFVLDGSPQSILIKEGEGPQMLVFWNKREGGLELVKTNAADRTERIPNVTFEIRRAGDNALVDTVTTDRSGRVFVPLDAGHYYALEIDCPDNFRLDDTPHYFEVKDNEATLLEVTNQAFSGIKIHKTNSATGEGIYGVTFLLYDSRQNPIGQYTSDQNGWVYIDDLPGAGRYYLRELENEGYVADTQLKTVYVEDGATTLIEWENTPIMAQIQIIKKSADDNPINGLPAGSLLEGAVFEIYDKAGNVVDTIRTDRNGRAVSKLLPLSRYTIRETRAPAYYSVNPTVMTAYLEHEGQIVTFEVENDSVGTGVNIKKTGYAEVMPGQPIKYTISGVGNTSTVPLSSFYWRDTLPAQVTLTKLVTGTYNQQLSYKVVYKTNLSGDAYLTLADNLSTTKNYVLEASPAALGLAANERVTEFMYVFGTVKAGFAQVETPYIHGTVIKGLSNGVSFVNVADVGGLYDGQWIMGVSRWVTTVYAKTNVTLPKTGY